MCLAREGPFEGFFSSVALRLLPVILVRGSPASTAAMGLRDKTTLAKDRSASEPFMPNLTTKPGY